MYTHHVKPIIHHTVPLLLFGKFGPGVKLTMGGQVPCGQGSFCLFFSWGVPTVFESLDQVKPSSRLQLARAHQTVSYYTSSLSPPLRHTTSPITSLGEASVFTYLVA